MKAILWFIWARARTGCWGYRSPWNYERDNKDKDGISSWKPYNSYHWLYIGL